MNGATSSTWPCPTPSGFYVLTTQCRSVAPVSQTSGSRCSSYIPSKKAWLLIWRKSLPESIMLFALNCESALLQFVLLLNGGKQACSLRNAGESCFLFVIKHKCFKETDGHVSTQLQTLLFSAVLCNLSLSLTCKSTIYCYLISVET